MDYSFLIGLHFRDDYLTDEMKNSPNELSTGICFLLPPSSIFPLL